MPKYQCVRQGFFWQALIAHESAKVDNREKELSSGGESMGCTIQLMYSDLHFNQGRGPSVTQTMYILLSC